MYVFLEFERKQDGPTGTFDKESISKLLGNDLDFHSVITVGGCSVGRFYGIVQREQQQECILSMALI